MKNIWSILKDTFALKMICSIFDNDDHNIVSKKGWEKLNTQRKMTQEELADKILARYEDDREYHFHQVDREWIIEAMIEFANEINTKEK
jgi:hypothetical protein